MIYRIAITVLLFLSGVAGRALVETPVDTLPDRVLDRVTVSPDARRVAVVKSSGGMITMCVNGVGGGRYSDIIPQSVIFSPDGKRHAYVARENPRYRVLVDGVAGRLYEAIGRRRPAFMRPDDDDLSVHMRMSIPYPMFVPAETVYFSPDSRHVAYAAQTDAGWRVVLDGVEGPPFLRIGEMVFSDSGRLAYVGETSKGKTLVVDGRVVRQAQLIDSLTFSPGGKRFAHRMVTREGTRMVIDGNPGPVFYNARGLLFSPDSRRVAYVADTRVGNRLIVNGKEFAASPNITDVVISPDSKHIACAVGPDGLQRICRDGKLGGRAYEVVAAPVYSRDSKKLAYLAGDVRKEEWRWRVVCDGAEQPSFIRAGTPRFSPDGKRLAYLASSRYEGGRQSEVSLYANGRLVCGPFPGIPRFAFTADGRLLAVTRANGGMQLLLEGKRLFAAESILPCPNNGSLFSQNGGIVSAIILRGNSLLRIEEKISGKG